jgi:1,4-dihydroxy-2-naphthoate octaprenyltransferase
MSIISFFKLVEIQTKVASIIPFSLGSLYALYKYNDFNYKNFIFMLLSLLAIDMATTAINNYYDYKTANKTTGYNYESHNAINKYNLEESTVKTTILLLLLIAITLGIILVLNSNFIVLILGMLSFVVGICYSFGPIPISHTPLGEIFSGLFMGLLITFLAIYIHVFDLNIINLLYQGGLLNIQLNIEELIYIFLFSLPPIIGIANIMLANNICDIKDDLENNRYTLPIYIGKDNSLKLYKFLYYFIYLDLILLLILQIIPVIFLITLLTFIPIQKNIKLFLEKQSKKETFVLAVKNFMIINLSQILTWILVLLY